jgi:tRNA(His) guanylyltransferase
MTRSDLSTRMKSYEGITHMVLPRRTYIILRVDGRAFHTYLRKAERPFDLKFMGHMNQVTELMCRQIPGTVIAYTQSDEISFLLQDFSDINTEPWYGGVVQKIASVSAAMASVFLDRLRNNQVGLPPQFDARVFPIGNAIEVANYFLERQQDCRRNAVSMIARTMFSDRELNGKNVSQRIEMIEAKQGQPIDSLYPEGCRMGRIVLKEPEGYPSSRPGMQQLGDHILIGPGHVWNASPAPEFKAQEGTFLSRVIPPLPAFAAYPPLNVVLNGGDRAAERDPHL